MNIYAVPPQVPAPTMSFSDFADTGAYVEAIDKAETQHKDDLKQWLNANGWSGKHTGRIVKFGIADGYAQYMIAQSGRGTGRSTMLIHLPYGDAYQSRLAGKLSFKEILEEADHADRMDAYFNKAREDAA